jgi:threonine dehydrogenase-like Zn-dependent dehydrogenase
MSKTYRAIEIKKAGEWSAVRKPLQDPGPNQVRIRVEACGVCHSDAVTVEGLLPITFPRVPSRNRPRSIQKKWIVRLGGHCGIRFWRTRHIDQQGAIG